MFSSVTVCLSSSQAGRTEGVCEQLIDSDARALYEAGEGRKGKDSSVFIEILTSRSAPHLRQGEPARCPVQRSQFLKIFVLVRSDIPSFPSLSVSI